MKRHQHGVTLLELMAVIVIIGILASIAVPSYRNYILRAQRSEATAALLRVAAAEEKFYLQNNTYTDVLGSAGLNVSSGSGTEHGWYDVVITAPATFTLANAYLVTATAVSGQPQFKDTDCRSFTIRETGARDAFDTGPTSTKAKCWR